jgi:AraC-like DNA-binding protein
MLVESDEETANKIIPDTSIVMALRYRGNVQRMDGENKEFIPASVITGIRKSARLLQYSKQTSNLLVTFKEGGVSAFTHIPANELFDLTISSENIFRLNNKNEIAERLAEAKTNKHRINIIETFLLKKLINGKPNLLINNAIQLIKQQNGMVRIKDLAASLYVSQDVFEKRFRAVVGSTPKQYASIIRFRNLIKNYPSLDSLTHATYEAGYFDQSHFIKDFRLFTGQTPKEFFKSFRYW